MASSPKALESSSAPLSELGYGIFLLNQDLLFSLWA